MDIPATICDVAGVDVPDWMEGRPLPKSVNEASEQGREHVFTQYESYTPDCDIRMNTVFKDGWTRTVYDHTRTYDGTEGELYNTVEDPRQRVNLWNDSAVRTAISARSSADGSGTRPQSANARRSSPAGVGSLNPMTNSDDTRRVPGAGPRTLSAALTVSAVVRVAPDTEP